ncbi:MAG TPA: bifunctional UDP-N-acetylglucosamine diphosphorylase/glucosamine-1-phosphate N-acetyltransferase GlmU [Terriglobia bacterium]|nr:bifunctional UDP-N-acetylglucosamine diphosphorylase/glucosamine-1-phosphate N-acetyltransferase GlmU [Terriglobia bacterium]
MASQDFAIVILAAGKSTRFKSERSKLIHMLAGRPLGDYVVSSALAAGPETVLMVVGHNAASVRETLKRPGLQFVEQKQQRGTGHALIVARSQLEQCKGDTVVVVVGDAPLLRTETLQAFVEAHRKAGAAASVLTMCPDNPHGYGRIVRSSGSRVRAIVEEKICTAAQRRIREVSSGILCFSRNDLLKHLDRLSDKNAQKEYLLTDLVKIFNQQRRKVVAFPVADAREVLGVNDRVDLARMERILRLQKAEALMREGVTIVDPQTTYIDAAVEVGSDTVVEPGVSLLGHTRIGRGCTIRLHSTLTDSILGDRVLVRPNTVVTGCEIGSDVILGPFAHLRDGAVVESEARIGNFVEVKKSRVGSGTKAWHLTYLGDARLGEQVNVGAGTVTCNYDGEKKNPTTIEDGVFIGSGSMLVAPVKIGKGSYVAAGSAITEDVPAESLAVGRARQVNKEGWVREHKEQKAGSKQGPTPPAKGEIQDR